jgi:hypothetical protein
VAAAAEARAAQAPGREARRAQRMLQASLSPYVGWAWVVVAAVAGGALSAELYPHLPEHWSHAGAESDPASGIFVLVIFASALVCWLLRPLAGRRAVARERARLARLPFPVEDYLQELTRPPGDCTVTFTVRFADPPPGPAVLADAFKAVDGAVREDAAGTVQATLRCGSDNTPLTNAMAAGAARRGLRVLRALHARHPVARVSISVTN